MAMPSVGILLLLAMMLAWRIQAEAEGGLGAETRLLYGGSVKADNARELLAQSGGFLRPVL